MQIKHTLYFDGENRKFEGKIVDDTGNIFESGDLDEFMAAVELFHENDYSLEGIDQIDLDAHNSIKIEAHDDGCKCGGDCDNCDCEDPDCTQCCDGDDEDDEAEEDDGGSLDDWDVIEIDDRPILAKKVIHVHSLELLALAAAGIGLWKFVKNLLGR